MKKSPWIISILVAIATVISLQFMPDKVPAHYNFNNEIDRWGSKYELLIFPVFIFVFNIVFYMLAKNFEKKALNATDEKTSAECSSNITVIRITAVIITLIESIIHVFSVIKAYTISHSGVEYLQLDSLKIVCFLLGIMFIASGNILPKTRNNGFIGLRISWSMYNDITWSKSNRFSGIALMITGIITMITSTFTGGVCAIILMLIYLTAAVISSVCYAHKIYKEEISK